MEEITCTNIKLWLDILMCKFLLILFSGYGIAMGDFHEGRCQRTELDPFREKAAPRENRQSKWSTASHSIYIKYSVFSLLFILLHMFLIEAVRSKC